MLQRRFPAAILSFALLLLLPFGAIAIEQKPATDSKIKMLTRDCEKCRTTEHALMLIGEFRHQFKLSPEQQQTIVALETTWKERQEKGLVRFGTKWISAAEKEEAAKSAQTLVEQAVALINVDDYEGARNYLKEASETDMEGIVADFILGLHFGLNNESDDASKHFRKVLARTPDHVGALNNLAICEVKAGRYSEAIKHWEQAGELAPTNLEIGHNIGRVVYEEGKKRIKLPRNILDRFRKTYAKIAANNETNTSSRLAWLYSPPTAPDAQRPRNDPNRDTANLVSCGSQGTGFFIAKNFVLTNRHVVDDDTYGRADAVEISIPGVNGAEKAIKYRAEIVAVSDQDDLALLKCETLDLPALSLRESPVKLGEEVMALGFPKASLLGSGLKSTRGTISGLPDADRNTLLFDVVLNPGNSGGPLLDKSGLVVSVNSFMMILDQPISGGVTAERAFSFAKQYVPDLLAAKNQPPRAEWTDVAATGQQSTVLINVLFLDAVPLLASKAGDERMDAALFVDRSCFACKGTGRTSCRNPQCHGGKIQIGYTVPKIVGTGQLARQIDLQMYRKEDCPHCSDNAISCPDCRGTGIARE